MDLVAIGENTPVSRSQILALEASMRDLPQLELELHHHHAGGVYARELHIPAGSCLVGKIHRFEHVAVISKGDISVLTEDGVKRLQAGAHLVAPPGTKRVVYAHADTVWTTFHATELTDLAAIEAAFIAPSFEALEQECVPCLG